MKIKYIFYCMEFSYAVNVVSQKMNMFEVIRLIKLTLLLLKFKHLFIVKLTCFQLKITISTFKSHKSKTIRSIDFGHQILRILFKSIAGNKPLQYINYCSIAGYKIYISAPEQTRLQSIKMETDSKADISQTLGILCPEFV